MSFSLKGYVLEKPRVGDSNSPFTATPDNLISNSGAYSAVFGGTDESTPGRVDYLVFVTTDGDLHDAQFAWTKNEALSRFDYDSGEGRYKPLPGKRREELGRLAADSNATRLKVTAPTLSSSVAPYRLSVGTVGSGVSFTITTVAADVNFGSPTAGTVQLSLETGNLHWNAADLVTYFNQRVFFQRQSFYPYKESTGSLGDPSVDTILLNPIPATGQKPLLRFGFGLYLTGIERVNEAGFSSNPTSGTFEWARDTGRVKFNTTDLTTNLGEPVYYDGVAFAVGLTLPRQTIGTVGSPSTITGLPSSGADLVFRALPPGPGSSIQFPEVLLTTTFETPGRAGQVQVNPNTGAVQFATPDITAYGARQLQVLFGDLLLERGISMRFFRTPIDPSGTSASQKDVTAFYPVTDATFADPIVGMPFIFLPVAPIDDPSFPLTVTVEQGTGTFVGTLPRLDVAGPPAGLGYTIDFNEKRLFYAVRRNNLIVNIPFSAGVTALPDPLVTASNAVLELNEGSGYTTLTQGEDILLEPLSGAITFTEPAGSILQDGSEGSITSPGTFTDLTGNFTTAGVQNGDYLVVLLGALKGVYDVVSVTNSTTLTFSPAVNVSDPGVTYEIRRGKEVLLDRFFQEVLVTDPDTSVSKLRSVGSAGNSPRIALTALQLSAPRVRLGSSWATLVIVANDGLFSSPSALSAGQIEVSSATGNLNFSQADVTASVEVFPVTPLTQGPDYRIEPRLGMIQVTERLLARDELLVKYASQQDSTPNYVEERATFLVRKEIVPHSEPTSELFFNPLGRSVADSPAPSVYRGGRPQDSTQVSVNPIDSKITFLADVIPTPGGALKVTDALPHGAIVNPSERIYVDYYVYNAIGGENTTTVLRPPINLAKVLIQEGESSFRVKGDFTASFPSNHVLRIDNEQIYYLSGSSYDSSTKETTINLLAPQFFRDSFTAPRLYVSSGEVRTQAAALLPSYFVLETTNYVAIPRGMNRFKMTGDLSRTYMTGTVLFLSGGSPTVNDFYLVSGATFSEDTNQTEIVLTQTTARQYTYGTHVLRRSVRALQEASPTKAQTLTPPVITPPLTKPEEAVIVFRRLENQAGVLLQTPDDYSIDVAGALTFVNPLLPKEEFNIFYLKHRFVQGQLRASYTANIAPNSSNGLENQVLKASYTAFVPDTFYFRVETLTNFVAEVAQQYKDAAVSASPSGGPQTGNPPQPTLYEKGRESVFFQEGRISNEDIVARYCLKFYNDLVNNLEDALAGMDGRVVGDRDGRFLFDGTTGQVVASFGAAVNQIDDSVKVSSFPIDYTPPLQPFKFLGTYIKAYEPGAHSRFYPTSRVRFNYTVVGTDTSANTGDELLDLATTKLTGVSPTISRRHPRAKITVDAASGATSLTVDSTAAVTTLPGPFVPAFANGMKVVVRNSNGSYVVPEVSPLTLSGVTSTTLSFTPGLPSSVSKGATVHLAASDTSFQKNYRSYFDVGLDLEKGHLLFVKPYPPFDGSDVTVPAPLQIQPPNSGELLETTVSFTNTQMAPEKIPALYGKALNDDGDRPVPLIGPSYNREFGPSSEPGAKPNVSDSVIALLTAYLAATVAPYTGTGSLNVARTIITNTVSFPSPVPQVGDLVQITTGLNGVTQFRRITGVTANTVTVDVAFATQDTGFTFLVTSADNLVTGTITMVGAVITDASANFISAGVLPGHTVIVTQVGHTSRYQRRQVQSVDSATQITLTAPFTSTVTATYRIHNPRSTYSEGSLTTDITTLAAILYTNGNSELKAMEAFFASVLTDRLSPTTASGSVTTTTNLVGTGVNFLTSGVVAGDLVYIPYGQTNAGFYTIGTVLNATTLTLTDAVTTAPASFTFRVVKAFGASAKTLQDLFSVYQSTSTYYQAIQAFVTALSTAVQVLVPPGTVDGSYFARDVRTLVNSATITARKAYLPTAVTLLESILASNDRLYDRRYTWIDARVNLEKGLLPRKSRAIADRVKAQEEVLKHLIKLATVEG